MRISHREVAELERDPRGWAQARKTPGERFFSVGYDRTLKLGIRSFEKKGDAAEARKHIERMLARNELRDAKRI